MTMLRSAGATGFFGKVASHGDFVANRFDRGLRQLLDGWLQRSIEHSRHSLGAEWPRAFETMPVWRFVLTPGLVGQAGFAGLMMPSTDRVGRHFPLLLAARLTGPALPARAPEAAQPWFDEAERLLMSARGSGFDLERFDEALEALPLPPPHERGGEVANGRSFWWTRAGTGPARRFSAAGLPAAESFARFLGGEAAPSNVVALPLPPRPAPRPTPVLQAVGASHPGTRLRTAAAALTNGRRGDLHALAQGLGEAPGSVQAAELVVERLTRVAPAPTLADLVAHAKGALGSANTLLRGAEGGSAAPREASVVALVAAEGQHAVIWAGDLRCYLLRDGMMRCLTRDHVEVGLRRRHSRSVGGAAQFACDVATGDLLAGDRFLLAGADLVRLLGEREIAARLAGPKLAEVPIALIEDALIAGTDRNVAAVAIAASPTEGGS